VRFADYNAMAHNFAASFASGVGLLVGVCNEVYDEAREQPDGFIDIDFLTGVCSPGGSAQLLKSVQLYCEALPDFCAKHGAHVSELSGFKVRFHSVSDPVCGFTVHLSLKDGRAATTEYEGWQGKRARELNAAGQKARCAPERHTAPRPDISSD
jgi:hypothetical protein